MKSLFIIKIIIKNDQTEKKCSPIYMQGRAGQYCYFSITIDTKATIHDLNTVRYLQSLLNLMLHILSGNLRQNHCHHFRLFYGVPF